MDADSRQLRNRTTNRGKSGSGSWLKHWQEPESVAEVALEHGMEETSSG
jgi:hypothetical protein